jgi:pimeloyl-ACP methyl ester carboxylesterase
VNVDDLSIHTDQGQLFARRWHGGDGTPMVLLHDSLGCVDLWRDFPAQLAQRLHCPVVAYDRLGFGRSDPHPGRLDNDFIAHQARQEFALVLAACNLDRFMVFGHSVGGGMAVGCAAAYPERCVGLMTESAQAFVEDRTLAGIRKAQRAFQDPEQIDRLRKYHGVKTEWVLSAWIDTWLSPSFAAWRLDASAQHPHCAALVIHGDGDEFGSTAHPQLIAAHCKGPVSCAILAGVGHVPHRERPEEVLALLEGMQRLR